MRIPKFRRSIVKHTDASFIDGSFTGEGVALRSSVCLSVCMYSNTVALENEVVDKSDCL